MKRLAGIALVLVFVFAGCGARDDSDPPRGHSGLVVLTDSLTGCQYLALEDPWHTGVALTPRMGADGRQVCRRPASQEAAQ